MTLEYEKGVKDMPQLLSFNIWEAIIKIVVNVYQLAATPLDIVTSSSIVHFVQHNCLNSLLGQLKESTQAIVANNDEKRSSSI